jgi:hypothetical protein
MVAIHVIDGKIYLVDYSKDKSMKEVTLDEAVEIMIKAVSQ